MDITKEEGGQIKIAPHESATSTPQSSIEETGESTPEEATGEEGARADAGGDMESPVSLADLLGYEYIFFRHRLNARSELHVSYVIKIYVQQR